MIDIKLIQELHLKWLKAEPGGVRADLSGADLTGAYLSYANLSYAHLSGANLSDASLSYANLSYADLTGANLSYANLTDAHLSGANLTYANLSGASLFGANLFRVDLSHTYLFGFSLGAHCGYSWIYDGSIIVKIGCEEYPLKYWFKTYKTIGNNNKYDKISIKRYLAMLKFIQVNMKVPKVPSTGKKAV